MSYSPMQKASVSLQIQQCGAMVIMRPESVERAHEVAKANLAGGIRVLEISYTTDQATAIIEELRQSYKDELLVGAGTVLDAATARIAILAGAQFIIAPNYSEEVALICNRYQIPYAPGCTSLSEAIVAMDYGAAFVKAFPISDFYGYKLVKVFKTPVPSMPILASGGIQLSNVAAYIQSGCDCCGFGGLLASGTAEQITNNAKEIRRIIDETRAQMV